MTEQEKRDILIEQYKERKKQDKIIKQTNLQLLKRYGSEYFIAHDIKGV